MADRSRQSLVAELELLSFAGEYGFSEHLPDDYVQHIADFITAREAYLRKQICTEGMKRELCGHFKTNLIGDEHGHFICDACKILDEEREDR